MALNRRERLLSLGVGSVVAIALLQVSYNYVSGMFAERQVRIEALRKEIGDKEKAVRAGTAASKKLAEWRKRSLPTDAVMARALYKNWLAGVVERTGLAKADITLGADLPKPGIYTKTPVNLRAQGDLEQVIRLLYGFYRANHLHQIRQLTLNPVPRPVAPEGGGGGGMGGGGMGGGGPGRRWGGKMGGGGRPGGGKRGGGGPGGPPSGESPASGASGEKLAGGGMGPGVGGMGPGARGQGGPPKKVGKDDGLNYDVTLTIEALSLPGGDRTDRLGDGESKRLAFFDDAERYIKAITQRALFTPPKRDADPASDMFVTAVVKKEGKYQVWMNVRSSGATLKLSEDETFDVGDQKATIEKIEPQSIKIKFAENTRSVKLGKSLAEERGRWGGFGGGFGGGPGGPGGGQD
jgi:hypothetical protein